MTTQSPTPFSRVRVSYVMSRFPSTLLTRDIEILGPVTAKSVAQATANKAGVRIEVKDWKTI